MDDDRPYISLATLTSSRQEQLQRINDAGLVAQGRAFLLSLEPIKTEVGQRWPHRSEGIWEAVERALTKSMPPPDVFVRLNDTTVLVAVASADRYEGQVRCVEVLRSLLSFFLGRSADADVNISRLSSIDGGRLSAIAVDIAEVQQKQAVLSSSQQAKQNPANWTPPLVERVETGFIDLTHYGHTPFSLCVTPVWRLDTETISAYAIRLDLPHGLERLTDADQERISALTIGHLLPILEDYRSEGGMFALIVPLPFAALSARRSRMALIARCSRFQDIMKRAVIAEIHDLHPGIPAGLINETVAFIKPFVRVVTGSVQTTSDVSALYKEAAFHGIATEWHQTTLKSADGIFRAARRRTPNVIVHDVPMDIPTEQLRGLGASHVTWKLS